MECLAIVSVCFITSTLSVSGLTLNKISQCPYRQIYGDSIQQSIPIQIAEPQVHVTATNNNPYRQRFTQHNDRISYQVPAGHQQHSVVSHVVSDPTDLIIEHLRHHYINNALSNQKMCDDSNKKVEDIKRTSDSQVAKSDQPQVINNYFIVSPDYLHNKKGRISKRNKARNGTKYQRNDDSNTSAYDSNKKPINSQHDTMKEEVILTETIGLNEGTLQTTSDSNYFKNNKSTLNGKRQKEGRKGKRKFKKRQNFDELDNTKPEKEVNEFVLNDKLLTNDTQYNLNTNLVDKLRKKVFSVPEDTIRNFSSALKEELRKRKIHHNFSESYIIKDDKESWENDLFMNTPSHNDKKRRIHRKIIKDTNDEVLSPQMKAPGDERLNTAPRTQEQNYSWEVIDSDTNSLSLEDQLAKPERELNHDDSEDVRDRNKIHCNNDDDEDSKTTCNKPRDIYPNNRSNMKRLRGKKILAQQRNNRDRRKRKKPYNLEGSDNSEHKFTVPPKHNTESKKNDISTTIDKHNFKTRPVLKVKSITSDFKEQKRVIEESTTYKSVQTKKSQDEFSTSKPKSEIETVYGHSKVVKYGPVENDDAPLITYYLPENMQYEVDGQTVVIAKSVPADSFF